MLVRIRSVVIGSIFLLVSVSHPLRLFVAQQHVAWTDAVHFRAGGAMKAQVQVTKKQMYHRPRQPSREWGSAVQGTQAEGQHRATPPKAAAPEAPPKWCIKCISYAGPIYHPYS